MRRFGSRRARTQTLLSITAMASGPIAMLSAGTFGLYTTCWKLETWSVPGFRGRRKCGTAASEAGGLPGEAAHMIASPPQSRLQRMASARPGDLWTLPGFRRRQGALGRRSRAAAICEATMPAVTRTAMTPRET